jgi:hypothetical protein
MIERAIECLGVLFAMVVVTLLFAVATLVYLKALDAVRAFFYNHKHNRCDCPVCEPHLWAERPALYIAVDHPRPQPLRFWEGKSVDEICAELEEAA